jgi:hypothetical protein
MTASWRPGTGAFDESFGSNTKIGDRPNISRSAVSSQHGWSSSRRPINGCPVINR